MHLTIPVWLAVGCLGFVLVPWYGLEDGILRTPLSDYLRSEAAPGLLQAATFGRWWLWPLAAALLAPVLTLRRERDDKAMATLLIVAGTFGLLWLFAQGFAITHRGWGWGWLGATFGPTKLRQFGMGWGAALVGAAFLFYLTCGLARRGAMRGDEFVTGAIGLVLATVGLFVFWPVTEVLFEAAITPQGSYSLAPLADRLSTQTIWGLGCFQGERSCGVFWNSILLASIVGVTTTALGLAFALLAHRTQFPAKPLLRLIAVLPVITPPFVIGLAVILLFGRNGAVTLFLESALGIPPSRWIYGLSGLVLVQTLAFAPIAFMVLLGVVQGVSPSMEEAAQTLRASRWRVFTTVTLPLIRPGLANAFLIGFVESLADFGNPLVLAGNFNVLSTQIFFAIVGAQSDPGRAAALSIVLLAICLAAFFLQNVWLGKRSYTTVAGKGDSGMHAELPRRAKWLIYGTAVPWMLFTLVIYAMIVVGGFVKNFGRDNSFTLEHYLITFGIEWGQHGIVWAGRAWNSLFTTLQLSALAAPLTAAIGLLTAYLLARQTFRGKQAFEFTTMLSFAIPGTVIGVSYIVAFNVPPIELTGTGIILVICFVFRNMPVAIRAGVATLSQIDKSLDECSLTLRHGSFATLRRVVLPLLRPAIVAALVYSFVRAITSVSAVVFLVSAEYNLATAYIVNRVEVSEYGVAIAYSSALVVIMAIGIGMKPGTKIASRSADVEFRNVTRRFGNVVAVDSISFTIDSGTLVTLLGPSGCGKTTTLRMIAGLEMPSDGQIFIGGRDVSRLPATARDVSMVFQSYALFPHMNVIENVGYGLAVGGGSKSEQLDKAKEGLKLVGLAGYENRMPSELSGGQQQRVAVARALVLEPGVLLFDEPLSNLDAKLRRRMREEIRELQQGLKLTGVYVTHDQEEALAVSDRIIVMSQAKIAQSGSPSELYDQPGTRFVADFIGGANLVECEIAAHDGDAARIRLGGIELRLPHRGVPPGKGTLAIRPHAIRIDVHSGPGRLPVEVRKATYLGSHVEYTLASAIGELFAIDPVTERALPPGSTAHVDFAPRGLALVRD